MPTSKDFLTIAEYGLSGNKDELIKYLNNLLNIEVKNNRHVLYNGILKLFNKHSETRQNIPNYQLSKFSPATKSYDGMLADDIWIPEITKNKINSFIRFFKSNSIVELEKFNHLNKILLYGPPGTGKTTLGFYISRLLNKNIKYVKISDVISSRFGETMKNISDIFNDTKTDIIFIDEFDAFAKSRTDNNDVGELKRIVNSIIQTLDFQSNNKIIIVATNLIDSIDSAITRRFPFKIFVNYLEDGEKVEFFNYLILKQKNIKIAINKNEIKSMLEIMNLKSIDELKTFFEKSVIYSYINKLDKIELKDFLKIAMDEYYFNDELIKKAKKKNPEIIKTVGSHLQNIGVSKKDIANIFGIHRNTYYQYLND